MDVLNIIMKLLYRYSFKPNAALLKEYAKSKVTKRLNTLPPLEYLNSKFDVNCQLSEERYERLRKRFKSKPPFVFYFNPDIQLQEKVEDDEDYILRIGFFDADNVSNNKEKVKLRKVERDGVYFIEYLILLNAIYLTAC